MLKLYFIFLLVLVKSSTINKDIPKEGNLSMDFTSGSTYNFFFRMNQCQIATIYITLKDYSFSPSYFQVFEYMTKDSAYINSEYKSVKIKTEGSNQILKASYFLNTPSANYVAFRVIPTTSRGVKVNGTIEESPCALNYDIRSGDSNYFISLSSTTNYRFYLPVSNSDYIGLKLDFYVYDRYNPYNLDFYFDKQKVSEYANRTSVKASSTKNLEFTKTKNGKKITLTVMYKKVSNSTNFVLFELEPNDESIEDFDILANAYMRNDTKFDLTPENILSGSLCSYYTYYFYIKCEEDQTVEIIIELRFEPNINNYQTIDFSECKDKESSCDEWKKKKFNYKYDMRDLYLSASFTIEKSSTKYLYAKLEPIFNYETRIWVFVEDKNSFLNTTTGKIIIISASIIIFAIIIVLLYIFYFKKKCKRENDIENLPCKPLMNEMDEKLNEKN